jgi:secretion/DNA translocation related TadE-like protein
VTAATGARARRGERGAATVLSIAVLGVLVAVAAALGLVTAVVVHHRMAQSAADLAALAGAGAAAQGEDACAAAGAVAGANGAALIGCRVDGVRAVWVQVQVTGPHWLGQGVDPVAEARAGPA